MIEFQYAISTPPIWWKFRLTEENLQEAADYVASLSGSNATLVDGGIEWSVGLLPVKRYRAEVGGWLTGQPFTTSITQVGSYASEPLLDGMQPVSTAGARYSITETEGTA